MRVDTLLLPLLGVSTSLLKYTISFLYKIALKICDKIASKEPFAVYILLPMWMEGIPQANATQGLLYFQRGKYSFNMLFNSYDKYTYDCCKYHILSFMYFRPNHPPPPSLQLL